MVCGIFLKFNGSCNIYVFAILQFWKIVLRNKATNKTQTTKNQENFALCFGENCFTSYLSKFMQDIMKP